MKRLRYVYKEALVDRCACWNKYDVNDKYALKGDVSRWSLGFSVTKLEQKTLFAFAKSYIESIAPTSGPGLAIPVSLYSHQ